MRERLAALLAELLGDRFERGAAMAPYTTFRVGGPAWGLARPRSEPELARLLVESAAVGIESVVLGACSNVLISDDGLDALVILIRDAFDEIEIEAVQPERVKVRVGAGCRLDRLVARCVEEGWSGMEFAAGIPGTVGGAARMNAGTREGDMSGVIEEVRLISADGWMDWVPRDQMRFEYRSADLPHGSAITACRVHLIRGDKSEIEGKTRAMLDWRAKRHPQHLPSAGSIFRNPPGSHAAKLIEEAGLKGLRCGGAQVSEQHANFIVNAGNAAAMDIWELIGVVRARVREAFGVSLECEVRVLGEFR